MMTEDALVEREVCPLHAMDDYAGVWVSDEVGHVFTCTRADHPVPGHYTWFRPPPPPSLGELTGLAEELQLDVNLPAALSQFHGIWVEYGVLEQAYAVANPKDWAFLMQRYSHTAVAAKRYTATAFLAGVLARLCERSAVSVRDGQATGRWSYNGRCGYYTLPPEPDWNKRLTWEGSGLTVEYVPGQTEV